MKDAAAASAEMDPLPGQADGQPDDQSQKESKHKTTHQSITLPVLGMTCAACQIHVQAALTGAPGVISARVDLMRHRALVDFDPFTTGPQSLIQTIRDSGYDAVRPRTAEVSAEASKAGDSKSQASGGVNAALTIAAGATAMLFSMPLGSDASASGHMGWLRIALPWLYELPHSGLRWTLLAATAVLAVWAGGAIYRSAWKALLHRETNMNTLVSLGTLVALLYSAYGTVWPRTDGGTSLDAYFDSVLLIMGFLLLGKWLEGRARHRALAAVDALAALQPTTVRVRRNTGEVMVALDEVAVGELVVILPGERVPVDGLITSGRTTVDESMLTGEAIPLERGVGGRVLAGSLNYDGAVTVTVESAGAETTLSQIARLVEQAQGSRAPMERLADRASAVFVPIVLGLAVLTFAGWLVFAHSLAMAIAATVAVLVIACPCAMGLAVPAALTVAIGRGAQYGVLIKGGEALERLATLNAIAMDKTGTLTLGKPALIGIHALSGYAEEDLLRIAAAAEDHSAHPLAHAIVSHAREMGVTWTAADAVQIMPGRGLSAEVEGKQCLLGNTELLNEWSVPQPAPSDSDAAGAGVTRLWMAVAGSNGNYGLAGYFDARDTVRPSARATVSWLQSHGMQVQMLSGDSAIASGPMAQAVGIADIAVDLLPADKVSRIRDLQKQGMKVAMVGDGVNDAAALAQADAGFAMGAGAALAQEAGDVLLLQGDPAGVCTAIALARATVSVMRQNLGWAVGYNILGIPLAAGLLYPIFHVLLTPWMAAAAMAFSSVSVLLNSLRLRAWESPILQGKNLV